jgi:hypothetical protein
MNKIAIPTLLLGVVMIAGIFAFMPVQEASTVHTTAATAGLVVIGEDSTLNGGAMTCTSTADFTVDFVVSALADATTVTIGGTATATDLIFTADQTNNKGGNGNSIVGTVGGNAGETVTFASNADGEEGYFLMKTLSGATATCTSA